MRKQQKLDLEMALFGASHLCPAHGFTLIRHIVDQSFLPSDVEVEGCWDCPSPSCQYHVHESPAQSLQWGDRSLPEHAAMMIVKMASEAKLISK